MTEYYWDKQIEYLRNTRGLYYNDDYLQFLVQSVWKFTKPVNMIDYGCGFGYLGLKLLPLLPEGSTYTGIDKGEGLIKEAQEIYSKLQYNTQFYVCDLETDVMERQYDLAVSHAFLLHMRNAKNILQKMKESVLPHGKVICFEPHWIGGMANCYVENMQQSDVVRLGELQKLFEEDLKRTGKDGNIGMRLPILMSQLGLKYVECRISDKVNFLDQNMDVAHKNKLYHSLKEEGIGQNPGDAKQNVDHLIARGLSADEAKRQYQAELAFSSVFNLDSWLMYAPNMKISFGTV